VSELLARNNLCWAVSKHASLNRVICEAAAPWQLHPGGPEGKTVKKDQ
jgi:hypothetical protein